MTNFLDWRFRGVASFALALLAMLAAAAAQDKGDKVIVAGKRIGAATLTMTGDQMIAALGKPAAKIHISDGYLYDYGEFRVVTAEAGPVIRIETDSDAFHTAEGLGVGSMEPDIAGKLGAPAKAEDMKARADNLLITLGRRLCYEPGLVFLAEYLPRQPHATTRVIVRADGCAHAFD